MQLFTKHLQIWYSTFQRYERQVRINKSLFLDHSIWCVFFFILYSKQVDGYWRTIRCLDCGVYHICRNKITEKLSKIDVAL